MDGILYALLAFLLFIIVLGGLVLIHELGHFLSARALGVRVLEFGIGFPPRAKVIRSKGETLVTLNWLPIGGFVRMDGEDGDAAEDPRSFSAKSLPVRLTILVAGVAMNIVLAFVIFFGIAWLATPVTGARFAVVEPGSPAALAGLKPGDELFGVEDVQFEFFGDPQAISNALRSRAGQAVSLQIRHADGSTATVSARLRPSSELTETRGALGVRFDEQTYSGAYIGHDPATSAKIAVDQLARWGGLILGGLGTIVGGFITNPTVPPQASGPLGIAVSLADIFLGAGPILTLFVAGILSVNLGVVNILPFPPLDGGRMAMLIVKKLFGQRVSLRAERLTYAVGFAFLMVFIFWVTGFDILRLGQTP